MLRWKPQERGGSEVSEGEREWYVRLQEILVTKVTVVYNDVTLNNTPHYQMIHVVCMSTGNVHTYPIKETDT